MQKFSLTVTYHKKDQMKFFSQLDLTRIFDRALRRCFLPLFFSQGFRPRVKMSFARALKVGVEGSSQVTFYFTQPVSFEELSAKLSSQLPEGLTINSGIL